MPIRIPIQSVQSWLIDCPPEQAFVCIDGQRAISLKELVKMLERMDQQHYDYHVTREKNDFANWVQGVFKDGHLAANFRSARSKKETYQYAKRHFLMLERNLRDFRNRQDRRKQRQSRNRD